MLVRTRHSLRFIGTGGAVLAACAGAPAIAQDAGACAAMRAVTIAGAALEITAAERVPAGNAPAGGGPGGPGYSGPLPAHCRVDGVLERRKGVGGVEYGIRFALALPDNWTGRFLFQGGGGLNGAVNSPLGAAAAGSTPALARGFAVVSTDTGHQGVVFDGSFFADQEATLNFLYVANGKVTQVAKRLIRELLEIHHPVTGQKIERHPSFIVKLDSLARHAGPPHQSLAC